MKREFSDYLKKTKYNERTNMKAGIFLHTYCPKCGENLIENNLVTLIAVNPDGSEGRLELSPYLNVFEHRSDLDIQPGIELKDLICPHCRESIVHPEKTCDICHSRTAELSAAAVHQRITVLICMKAGCRWHGISPEDEQLLIQDSSTEW